jgi:hypothetical protein
MTSLEDQINHHTVATVEKWDEDQVRYVVRKSGVPVPKRAVLASWVKPYETLEVEGNLLTTVGLGRLTSLLIAGGGVALSGTTTTCLGVGDTSTAAAVTDTQLGSNSTGHSRYMIADSAPTRVTTTVTNDTVQVVATFTTSDGNFTWSEWGIVIVTTAANSDTFASTGTSPLLLNHRISAMGVKASGSSWSLTAKVSWA